MTLRWALIALLVVAAPAAAQETQFHADLRKEGDDIAESCSKLSASGVGGCALQLATGSPFHIGLGNLAPQNGFGFGLAFVEHSTPSERWRLSWNVDAVAATSGAWRAGAYLKIIRTPDQPGIIVVRGPASSSNANEVTIHEYPIFNVYAQTTSLKKLFFFGPGPSSTQAGQSAFAERETLVGTGAIVPVTAQVFHALRPALVGGVNGRFVRIRGNDSESIPSIEQLYDASEAPGVDRQPSVLQLEEGVRIKPRPFNGHLQLNYLADAQQFVASASSHSSFRRWTLDLKHTIPLYTTASSASSDTNGPDECFQAVGSTSCPAPSFSRNLQGSFGFRLLLMYSGTSAGDSVPFYFQPTLGGSDVNGQPLLSGYDDYRFRGPNLLALQETFEHSIWGPFGVWLLAEQGKVAERRSDLDFNDLAHSIALGLTLRAGGLPLIRLSFAWSGEGHHVLAAMDSSLLGGSTRPSLF